MNSEENKASELDENAQENAAETTEEVTGEVLEEAKSEIPLKSCCRCLIILKEL